MPKNKKKLLKTKFLSDGRGEIYVNKMNGLEFNIIFTRAGAYRAGDYHSAKQYSVILKGEVEITLRQNGKDVVRRHGPSELITIPPGVPHLYNFLIDTLMIEWLSGPYKPQYYKPYRKIIKQQLKNVEINN